ncbi:ribonuclease D [Desulfatiferula olefinivorans]
MADYLFIENEGDLKTIAEAFEQADHIAVDLEADSMFHFKEKVCLIQMASDSLTVVIDPLKIDDMSPLKPVFADPAIRKIFHGSDYDVRSLNRDYDIEVNNLFDTELASRFLGITETGLGSVLEKRFQIQLDKSFQKKDWSRRPLPREMIEYGAGDVIHLLALADILDAELKAKHRDEWVKEECELLSRVRCPQPNEDPLFLKIKGSGRLDRRSLSVLEHLLRYRLVVAEKKDKPLFKVFSNSSLLELSKKRPRTMDQLGEDNLLSRRQISTFGHDLLREIQAGLAVPDKDLPLYPRKKKPAIRPEVPRRIDRLKEWRDVLAQELCIDPPILLNKALMTELAVTNPLTPEALASVSGMKNWQIREFGDRIIALLKTLT